jgi:hypothetical protein
LAVRGDIHHVLNRGLNKLVLGREVAGRRQGLKGGHGTWSLYCLTVDTIMSVEMKIIIFIHA